jgi:hypothetical protein
LSLTQVSVHMIRIRGTCQGASLLVPLIYGVIVKKYRFDLDSAEKIMLLDRTVVDVECDDGLSRNYITASSVRYRPRCYTIK